MDQIGPHEHVEVGGAAQGAAALCGGGEPQQVGDRSRSRQHPGEALIPQLEDGCRGSRVLP